MTRLACRRRRWPRSPSLALRRPRLAAWTWPLHGEVVTAFRNGDDPYAAGQHRGIDIAGSVGAPVVAAAPGLVRFAGTAGILGVDGQRPERRRALRRLLPAPRLDRGAPRRTASQPARRSGRVGTTGVRSIERPTCTSACARRAPGTPTSTRSRCSHRRRAPAPRPPQPVPVAAPGPGAPGPGARARRGTARARPCASGAAPRRGCPLPAPAPRTRAGVAAVRRPPRLARPMAQPRRRPQPRPRAGARARHGGPPRRRPVRRALRAGTRAARPPAEPSEAVPTSAGSRRAPDCSPRRWRSRPARRPRRRPAPLRALGSRRCCRRSPGGAARTRE